MTSTVPSVRRTASCSPATTAPEPSTPTASTRLSKPPPEDPGTAPSARRRYDVQRRQPGRSDSAPRRSFTDWLTVCLFLQVLNKENLSWPQNFVQSYVTHKTGENQLMSSSVCVCVCVAMMSIHVLTVCVCVCVCVCEQWGRRRSDGCWDETTSWRTSVLTWKNKRRRSTTHCRYTHTHTHTHTDPSLEFKDQLWRHAADRKLTAGCVSCVCSNVWTWGSGCWGSRETLRRRSSASKLSSGWFSATSSSRSPWPPPCSPSPGSNPPAPPSQPPPPPPPSRAPRPRPCRRATPTARMTPTTSRRGRWWFLFVWLISNHDFSTRRRSRASILHSIQVFFKTQHLQCLRDFFF